MSKTWEQLKRLFVEDHRMMTRGYRDLLGQLKNQNLIGVEKLAAELDRRAGPHIEFEEKHLYPRVRESRGDEYADHMYEEHREILSTLIELQQIHTTAANSDEERQTPSDRQMERWKKSLQEGLDHAAACGTLLSHLQTLPEKVQEELLNTMEQLRKRGAKWSSLPSEIPRATDEGVS